jgi:chromosome segregation ATPase
MDDRQDVAVYEGTPGWMAPAIVFLALVAVAGLGFGWYDYSRINDNQQAMAAQTTHMKTTQDSAAQQIAALDQRLTQEDSSSAALQSDLGVVTKRLRLTQGELKTARDEAVQIRTDSEQKIADLNTNVTTQLATKASTDDLSATNSSVTGVKTDLEGTKNDLKMARSELGTLIARNHDEVDVLRRSGERDYIEFTITGRNKPQKIGNISAQLRSVDTKKNKFTVALLVDDLSTEKKDRTVNEPIVFYQNGSHQADEFVVNSVSKDKISGYISMPKNPVQTSAAALGN